jgi:hypothetical protein
MPAFFVFAYFGGLKTLQVHRRSDFVFGTQCYRLGLPGSRRAS